MSVSRLAPTTPPSASTRVVRADAPRSHWTHRARLGLLTFTVLATIGAGALFFWPTTVRGRSASVGGGETANDGVPRTVGGGTGDGGVGGGEVPTADTLAALVVNGNIFSASRRAPAVRFMAPGRSIGDAESVDMRRPDGVGANSMTAGEDEESTGPVVSGIIVQDGERQALLQLTATDGVPRLYREGDTRNGFRIVRIGVDHVVISSRGTSRTYRLASPPTPSAVPSPPEHS